jgi:hypothetical protein
MVRPAPVLAAAFLLTAAVSAAQPAPQAASGRWEGACQLEGGERIPVVVTLRGEGGTGWVDAGERSVRAGVAEAWPTASGVDFGLREPGEAAWLLTGSGAIDGDMLRGSCAVGMALEASGALRLRRHAG